MSAINLTRRQFAISAAVAIAGARFKTVRAADALDLYVCDVAWLQNRIASDPNLVILDASALATYRDAHIPGAIHAWWQDTMEWNNPVYGTSLSTGGTGARRQVLQDLGIDDGVTVVAYDGDRNRWAARMVWFLRWLGHPGAAMLDGGLAAWREAGGSIESGSNDPAARSAPSISAHSSLNYSTKRLLSRMTADALTLVDVRTDEEAHNDVNGIAKLGRIPNSISLPWTQSLQNGHLKPRDELIALFNHAGIVPTRQVILYGRYGVDADQSWVVLKAIGYADAGVYDDGFVGWQMDPRRPIVPL